MARTASVLGGGSFTLDPVAFGVMAASCGNPESAKRRHVERGDEYAAEKRDQFAVEANHGRRLGRQMKVGGPHLDHLLQKAMERGISRHTRSPGYVWFGGKCTTSGEGNKDGSVTSRSAT